MSALAVIPIDSQPLEPFRPQVEAFIRASRAANTLRGYRADWSDFCDWCAVSGLESMPAAPETVAAYIATVADRGLKAGSVQRRVSAIAAMHQAAGFDSPTGKAAVRLTLAGIRRALGTRQECKAALLTADLAAMVSHLPAGLKGTRDRALLLLGFAGAFRRSELCGLDVEDLAIGPDGVKITVRRSKTDQEGAGQAVGIARGGALCPVAALEAWLRASGITAGPVFRAVDRHGKLSAGRLDDRTVARTVKGYAAAAGLDAAKYSGHSLRAGLATQAALNDVPERIIQKQTRHKSSDMLRRYIRDASLFRENASARVGL
jgi:site-specific recombinase XerD